jgi:hypothetical protein
MRQNVQCDSNADNFCDVSGDDSCLSENIADYVKPSRESLARKASQIAASDSSEPEAECLKAGRCKPRIKSSVLLGPGNDSQYSENIGNQNDTQ